jgi:DNA polymerase-3 subunit alpha
MAAVLSADMQTTDKVVINVEECREMGLNLLPPDINRGEFRFVAKDKNNVVYGLGAIKGLGEGPVEGIVSSRRQDGMFEDLFNFCERVDSRKVNKKAIDALIGCGALDELVADDPEQVAEKIDYKRALLYANQEDAVRLAEQKARNAEAGHTDLFGEITLTAADNSSNNYNHFDSLSCLTLKTRLGKEKDTLGFYLTGHPIDLYKQELKYLAKTRIADLRASESNNSYANNSSAKKDGQTIAGLIVDFRTMKSRRGEIIAFLTLDDRSGRVEVSVFGDLLDQNRDKLVKDAVIVVKGSTAVDDYTGGVRMRANEVYNLVDARENNLTKLKVNICNHSISDDFSGELASILSPFKGKDGTGCRVAVEYMRADAKAEVILGEAWRVKPDDELIQNLRDRYGADQVHLDYS